MLDEQRGNATEHPPARDRPRPAQRPRVGQPQRLDHARPRRHRQASHRVPLDPARSRRRDPGLRKLQDQRGDAARRPAAGGADRQEADRPAGQPRRRRRLQPVREPDRQARRHRRHGREADRLQVRLPLCDRGAVRPLARLALRQGEAAHGRPPRADLLPRPQERARPVGHGFRPRRAQPAGAERGGREADELRDARRSSRSSATTCSRRSRPTCRRTRSSRSAGRSSARAVDRRCTAGSAASPAAARSAPSRRTSA